MKTNKFILMVVCILTASFCYSQNKTISKIPIMNSNEYSWCSRQVLEVSVDSLAKTDNSIMKFHTDSANSIYKNKSKLLIDDLLNIISSGKIKVYSQEGAVLTISEVNTILSTETNVLNKAGGLKKTIKGQFKKNITLFRIIEDVYINKNTLKFETKPLAIMPVAIVYDSNGEVMGLKPLFYIYF